MVTEKNAGSSHDFLKDPIRLLVEGDWLTADGTTLGADNGMGVSAALALLDCETPGPILFCHPPTTHALYVILVVFFLPCPGDCKRRPYCVAATPPSEGKGEVCMGKGRERERQQYNAAHTYSLPVLKRFSGVGMDAYSSRQAPRERKEREREGERIGPSMGAGCTSSCSQAMHLELADVCLLLVAGDRLQNCCAGQFSVSPVSLRCTRQ